MNHVRPWKGKEREWNERYVEEKKQINKQNKQNHNSQIKPSQLINWNGAFYEELRYRNPFTICQLPCACVALIAWHEHIRQPLFAWLPGCLAVWLPVARPVGRLSGHRLAGIIIIYIKLRGVSAASRLKWKCCLCPSCAQLRLQLWLQLHLQLQLRVAKMPVAQCNALVFLLRLRYENTFSLSFISSL